MKNVEWGEYRIGDLFDVKTTKSIDKNKIVFANNSEYDFIGRSSTDNGIQGKIDMLDYEPNPKKTYSLSQVGESVCQFRNNEWYASQNIFILTPKTSNLIKNHSFITTVINKSLYNYKSAYIYPTLNDVKALRCLFPQRNNEIDYGFIEELITELEAQRITELEAYLKVSGLDNYKLSKEEKKLIDKIDNIEFYGFDITEIFDIYNTHNILSRDIVTGSGSTPYLCASSENNSISSYISYQDDFKEKGNCVFIGGKTFVVTYQKDDFFSNDSHNLTLYMKDGNVNRLNQLFLVTCIYKSLSHKYSWGDSVSKTKIKKDKLFLPATNGKPDFEIMEKLISVVQKLVIKDVVQYADKKISATKSAITKE